jgi:arsenate reductase
VCNPLINLLIPSTGNSARSHMAEGLLRRDAGDRFTVESAGTKPSSVRPEAISVLKEVGVDITSQRSKHVDEFAGQDFDYVLTVCDNAKESCPVFFGKATRMHHNFNDPARRRGSRWNRLAAAWKGTPRGRSRDGKILKANSGSAMASYTGTTALPSNMLTVGRSGGATTAGSSRRRSAPS